MASRKEQKEQARQRRLAEEQARAQRAARMRRLQMLGGVVVAAVIVIVVAIVVSSGSGNVPPPPKPNSARARAAAAKVTKLLAGIPQHGNVLGSPTAPVTMTEFGDLVCPICKVFALGGESQLIANEVRAGKVKLVYRALETASGRANNSMFVPSQVAARAAGLQQREWNYIELFYYEQGDESSSYVTDTYLNNLAVQIPGLSFSKWSSDRQSSTLSTDVSADAQAYQALGAGQPSTPTITFKGPKAQSQPVAGALDYSQLESLIKQVS
ncbi:MAG: DsbA family protein [Solirubrobacteraceae bacterium]